MCWNRNPFFFLAKPWAFFRRITVCFCCASFFCCWIHANLKVPVGVFFGVFFQQKIGPKKTSRWCDINSFSLPTRMAQLVLWKNLPGSLDPWPASHPPAAFVILPVILAASVFHRFSHPKKTRNWDQLITPYDMMNKKTMEVGNFYFFGRRDPGWFCVFFVHGSFLVLVP